MIEKRKFIDLQNYNLEKAVDARLIDNKFSGLKWITPAYYDAPLKEIDLIKASINILKKDRRRKMVITNYQFLSSILEEDTNLINRWYTLMIITVTLLKTINTIIFIKNLLMTLLKVIESRLYI